jgi:hypothetical protein
VSLETREPASRCDASRLVARTRMDSAGEMGEQVQFRDAGSPAPRVTAVSNVFRLRNGRMSMVARETTHHARLLPKAWHSRRTISLCRSTQ